MRRIREFAEKLSNQMADRGIVQKEDVDLYRYGIENGITVAGNLAASAVLGVLTGRLGMVLVFLLFYSILRSYSGGMHCKSKAGCFVLSMLILLIPVFSYEWVMEQVSIGILLMIGAAAVTVILILSPVESINKRLDDEERKFYRRISHCIVALQICVLGVLYGMSLYEFFYAGYCSIVLVAVFMILGWLDAKHYT